ncbi:MAG: LysR family transcriptional regulator [Devosia nanyangense]|uniref:LysR family transcriptional regulator n=1 Tax=Devosia nanyangense TaxID=1228055 RepID=A0A933L541_9HYPH|nr:LysR family transcriptional regulator [Devosia nanyangense]
MSQDLSRIRAFVQVFDAGGFSAAARQHGRSKALLSKYVTDLEDYLGVRLMNRTTRKLSLTEAGEAYYREASQLLQQLDDLDASILDQTAAPRGLLRVSAARNFGEMILAPAIFVFLAEHPDVTLDLRLEDRFVDLVDEGIDVALRIGAAQDSSLIARKIADMQHSVVGSPAYLKARGTPRAPEDLRGHFCVVDTNFQGQANWRFIDKGATVSVHVSGPVRVNSPLSARDAALAGLGLALLPGYLADPMIASGKLVSVLADYVHTGSSLQAVYPHRRHLAGKVRALIDHLVAWFEAHPVS